MSHFILGAGVTGLAAGMATGFEVLEATERPGGICSSYYVRPGSPERLASRSAMSDAYRFEIGGGHWIFGGDPTVLHLLESLAPQRRYRRRSAIYFGRNGSSVPYPLQNHLRHLEPRVALEALVEMTQPGTTTPARTLKSWLATRFGGTLCDLFFFPFHERYTASLYDRIAPQDEYKSPTGLSAVIRGALADTEDAGYNVTFRYPMEGLDVLATRMSSRCQVRYGCAVQAIRLTARELVLHDGRVLPYRTLLSTLPLNRILELTGLGVPSPPDPHTSVLVLNIGALRGPRCPQDHWVYVPDSASGFHRVGFYSNVDAAFLPAPASGSKARVAIYVEKAFEAGSRPDAVAVRAYSAEVIRELQAWGFVEEVEVVDPTWIDVAYTWRWPESGWVGQASVALAEQGIHTVGRYGRWVFQGIADSVRDGLLVGAALSQVSA
ncbi:MAG TPA: FAD-dependent oxidoreductase [Anaeromyxobacteraceae bacterium]|nr:FAD-dependent oxidoreductase [Anaeromyxobacteraceae bacterium]